MMNYKYSETFESGTWIRGKPGLVAQKCCTRDFADLTVCKFT